MANSIVRFCNLENGKSGLDPALSQAFPAQPNHVILNKHNTSLRSLGVDVKHVVGCAHKETQCSLCREIAEEDDPFLNHEAYAAERRTVLYLEVLGRQTVRDAVTWLMAHKEWLRASSLKWYFYNTYPILASAMDAVNVLGPIQLDGHIIFTMAQGEVDIHEMPIYCSWMLRPRSLKAIHFYIPTKVPPDEVIFDYLSIMLGIGHEFTRRITHATIQNEDQQEHFVARRLSVQKPLKSPRAHDAEEGIEVEDPRRARADRLEKRTDLRDLFNVNNPRLMLLADGTNFRQLEPRPDYLFKPHDYYINVFYVSLPVGAPVPYIKADDATEKW